MKGSQASPENGADADEGVAGDVEAASARIDTSDL